MGAAVVPLHLPHAERERLLREFVALVSNDGCRCPHGPCRSCEADELLGRLERAGVRRGWPR